MYTAEENSCGSNSFRSVTKGSYRLNTHRIAVHFLAGISSAVVRDLGDGGGVDSASTIIPFCALPDNSLHCFPPSGASINKQDQQQPRDIMAPLNEYPRVTINCDMGEVGVCFASRLTENQGFARWTLGPDDNLMPLIDQGEEGIQ